MARAALTAGCAATKACEGPSLSAYRDSVGAWTIGVGHAATAPTLLTVCEVMAIARDEAEEILSRDFVVFGAPVRAADAVLVWNNASGGVLPRHAAPARWPVSWMACGKGVS